MQGPQGSHRGNPTLEPLPEIHPWNRNSSRHAHHCQSSQVASPWDAKCHLVPSPGSNQSILKEISPEYSLEGLMWKLKLQSLVT